MKIYYSIEKNHFKVSNSTKGILCPMALFLHGSERKHFSVSYIEYSKDVGTPHPLFLKYKAVEGKW